MVHATVVKAREAFAEFCSRAVYGHERIVLTKHGKPFVALVSIEDLRTLERIEQERDLAAARAAQADTPDAYLSYDDFRAKHAG